MSKYNSVGSKPKSINFSAFNVESIVVYNAVDRLLISESIPEIFTVKVESCLESRRILDVFCLPKF